MLKSNKGVTLTSLVIYVIVLMIVVALMSGISARFYTKTNEITIKENSDEQFSRFLSYLTKDTNSENIKFIKSENGQSDIANYIVLKFDDGVEHQYLFNDNRVYYTDVNFNTETEEYTANKIITICYNVKNCTFTYDNTTKILTIRVWINDIEYTKTLKVNY